MFDRPEPGTEQELREARAVEAFHRRRAERGHKPRKVRTKGMLRLRFLVVLILTLAAAFFLFLR